MGRAATGKPDPMCSGFCKTNVKVATGVSVLLLLLLAILGLLFYNRRRKQRAVAARAASLKAMAQQQKSGGVHGNYFPTVSFSRITPTSFLWFTFQHSFLWCSCQE